MKSNFYKLLFGAGVMLSMASVQAQCDGQRYLAKIFPNAPTKTTVTYSTTSQAMDIYEPAGDVATNRRVIIFAHGGSFTSGSKAEQFIVDLCKEFAKRGYVTASIDYRLATGLGALDMQDSTKAYPHVMRALSDAKAAIRYFRKDAATTNTYKIDSNFIAFGGNSAGAIIATHVAYVKTLGECTPQVVSALNATGGIEGNSGNPGYGSSVQAVLNYAGALLDTNMLNAGDVEPIYSAHGDADGTVPYAKGQVLNGLSNIVVFGSGAMKPRLDGRSIKNQLHTYVGADHVPWSSNMTQQQEVEAESAAFLYSVFCPNYVAINDVNADNLAIELYPNPSSNVITLKSDKVISSVTIVDQLGRTVLVKTAEGSNAQITINKLNAGVYFAKVTFANQTNIATKRFVVE